ncbi:MAG: LysE family translocator [Pseudomonadota bacterium]
MLDNLATLLVFCFLGTGTPGPNNVMLMTSGMNYGVRRTLWHILGVATGVPVMVVGVGLGLNEAFDRLPWLATALKYVCAIYLVYLAYRIAVARPEMAEDGELKVSGKPLTYLQAAAFQWVNPKAWFIVTTALSVYALPVSAAASTLIIAACFLLSGTVTASTWTVLGDKLRILLSDPRRLKIFNLGAAVTLVLTLVPAFVG